MTMEAFGWGIASAVSLPLGAVIGLWWRPRLRVNSAFMAFGAGALLFALTIELFGHVPEQVAEHGTGLLVAAIGGAIAGGVLFDLLNQLVNNRGAFLRRLSQAKNYVVRLKIRRGKQLVDELGRVKVFQKLSPAQMAELVSRIRQETFTPGQIIFHQGEAADEMFFIIAGKVNIILEDGQGRASKQLAQLSEGDTFGELGILSGAPRSATAQAVDGARVYKIFKQDFDEIIEDLPELQDELKTLAASRVDDLGLKTTDYDNQKWRRETMGILERMTVSISPEDISEEAQATTTKAAGGAALAIWLGILIDGIPESLVIGMLTVSVSGISMAFLAGVFLANLPEAMSSAVSMRNTGMSLKKIMLMWGSICLLTGIGAAIGAVIFPAHPQGAMHYLVMGIEGLAAGAMLTMIAETMLPEAFEQGGSIIGLSTLAGFLAALLVKVS